MEDEIDQDQLSRANSYMLELRKLRPLQSHLINGCKSLMELAKDSIDEHNSLRKLLNTPDATFLRVDKNIRTIASWVNSVVIDSESRINRVENSISTVSIKDTKSWCLFHEL